MNEDDTYRRLKQIPFEQMRAIYNAWYIAAPTMHILFTEAAGILAEHGWTEEEYRIAHEKNGTFIYD